jgi:hypothetical protein
MRKILSHAIEVVGTGDNVLPVSKFIRDNCNKNISNIRTIFVPLPEKEFTDRNVRDMEIAVARHMKMIHPDLVKNVSFGKAPTRPKAKELAPALEGL